MISSITTRSFFENFKIARIFPTKCYEIRLFSSIVDQTMRSLTIATTLLLFSPLSHAEVPAAKHSSVAPPAYAATIKVAPFLNILEKYIQSAYDGAEISVDIDELTTAAGLKDIDTIQHSNRQTGDTWLNTLQLNTKRPQPGIFKLLGPADPKLNEPFFAPASTDIAAQISLKLGDLPELLTALTEHTGQQEQAKDLLGQKIGDSTLKDLLDNNQARLHLAVDFDDKVPFNLGRVQIGRPHVLLRIDGINPLIEKLIEHYIKTRNVPLKRTEENGQIIYRLPKYLILASAGYLPVITLDTISNTTCIASSQKVLDRVRDSKTTLADDPQFLQTWQEMPAQSSAQFYISKRLLNSTEQIYLRALEEEWTDNPTFLAQQPIISQLIKDLNNSESGIAFSHVSQGGQQIMSLKAPLPSVLILLALAL
jgi:hypothetical protein